MSTAANQPPYSNPAWGPSANGPPWRGSAWNGPTWNGGPGWNGPPFWAHPGFGRPAGIAATVLGFILWWPVGLAILFYMIGSGRMGCWGRRQQAAYRMDGSRPPAAPWSMWRDWCASGPRAEPASAPTSGNRAFDEYRTETLRRLEEEQNEFGSFLDRLRFAKDKAEFDAFMAERRQAPRPTTPPEEANRV